MNASVSAVDLASPSRALSVPQAPPAPSSDTAASSEHASEDESAPKSGSRLKSFGAWLQERSKSLNEVHLALKPWKKRLGRRRSRGQRSSQQQQQQAPSPPPQQRQLPPVPPPPQAPPAADPDSGEELLNGLAIDLENMAPGTAYLPDDHYDFSDDNRNEENDEPEDFATSLERVKECGWYWGPISGDAAERLLLLEPDGSFVVRDSSDDRYLFSLTFKLNDSVRHVRIEHEQGYFSFGTFTKFKSHTITAFIENAVRHSRSGRYLFFLHRRPVLGPMRVQLLHPVSRFKKVQSLQHQCRFVILKLVPRDLLHNLPLPPKIQEYLNTPFYYSESIAEEAAHEEALRQIAKAEAEEKASQEVNKVSESSANSTSEVANRISEEANPASEGAPS